MYIISWCFREVKMCGMSVPHQVSLFFFQEGFRPVHLCGKMMLTLFWFLPRRHVSVCSIPYQREFNVHFRSHSLFFWREHQIRGPFIKSELLPGHSFATSSQTEDLALSGCEPA